MEILYPESPLTAIGQKFLSKEFETIYRST